MEKFYENLGWPDFEAMDRENTIVAIPVGATEQHGRHLPLGTDSIDVWHVAKTVAAAVPEDFPLLIFPLLPVGLSVEHMHYPGSVTLQPDTLYHVALDICESLVRHGFKRIIFFNGHGGNTPILSAVSFKVRADHGVGVFLFDVSTMLVQPDRPAEVMAADYDGHAGELETDLVLAARPETVRLDRAEATCAEHFSANKVFTLAGPVSVGWLSNDFGSDTVSPGNCGDPRGATREKGEAMVKFMADKACAALREILDWPLDVQLPGELKGKKA